MISNFDKKNFAFIRFMGQLWENMLFDHIAGFEMEFAPASPEIQNSGFEIDLLDKKDKILVTKFPQIEFRHSFHYPGKEMKSATVECYVPIHPLGTKLVFKYRDTILYTGPVAKLPPTLEISKFKKIKNNLIVDWQADHDFPLMFSILVEDLDKNVYPIVSNLNELTFNLNIKSISGHNPCKLIILATDGLRSNFIRSKSFQCSEKEPTVWIQSPLEGSTFPVHQPITLSGKVTNLRNMYLMRKSLTWYIDGETLSEHSDNVLLKGLPSGRHKVKLVLTIDNKSFSSNEITFHVTKLSSAQKKYLHLLSKLEQSKFRSDIQVAN